MTTQQKNPTVDYTNPAGWNGYGAAGFSWCSAHLDDYPDSSSSRITCTTTADFHTDHYSSPGSEFSIPVGATVNSVSVRAYIKKNSASSCSVALRIRQGSPWRDGSAQAVTTTSALYTETWTTNPGTGAAWTPAQLNDHTASNSVTMFGFHATDATAEFDVFSFVLEVDYTVPSSPPVFSGTIPANTGTTGAAFSWAAPTLASYFTGSGITYTVSTSLSAIGLSIDGSTGVISGTGTTGTWTGTVTATNVDGSDTSNSFTITISPAPADLSSPTVTSVGATTATCGFSTDTATGNAYFLRRTGLSAASAATIISTGESQAISGTGAQTRAMTAFTSGLTYYVDMAQTGSTEVVTAGPFYPGTGRPVSDVDVTGWTASTGSDLWAMLDEDTASDADYVTSPALSGSATTGSHALDKTYTAGTYSIKVRAKTDTGAGTLAVRLLNGSNVSQGVTADQAITSTWTTYTLAITTTGDATRIRYEVVAA